MAWSQSHVGAGKAYAKMQNSGQYWFCNRQCLDQFEAERQRYISKGGMS
jgi:YHS domain-containing protein